MADDINDLVKHARRRWAALKSELSSWEVVWRDIKRFIAPNMGVFTPSDRKDGRRQDSDIIDNTATRAMRTLGAGLIAGLSSPSQPWFRLKAGNRHLRRENVVRGWLDDVAERMMDVFAESNAYRALHALYEELATFGTGVAVLMEDFDSVIHVHHLTVGSYALATDAKDKVNTMYRRFEMTVDECVREFGPDAVSPRVRDMYKQGLLDKPVIVIHAIEPRPVTDRRGRSGALGLAYREVYFEEASWEGEDRVLRESGYRRFNVLAPRWIVNGNSTYGTGPGRDALGDVKSLQLLQIRKAQAIDYMTKPPVQAPTNLKGQNVDLLPGGVTYSDLTNANGGLRSVFEVRLDISHLTAEIQDTRQRISSTFYEDLFRMVSTMDRSGITARQISEQHAEKMMMLGPVIERVGTEALSELITFTFEVMMEAGLLPEPPAILADAPVTVEFVSLLAQAQKQSGVQAVDRLVGTVSGLSQVLPETLDKLDGDEIVDMYTDLLGVTPRVLRTDEQVEQIRNARAQAQAQAAQAEQEAQAASTTRDLAQASATGSTDVADALATAQMLGE